MYQNPVLNAPLGPDGIPVEVAPEEVMDHYEVRARDGECWQPLARRARVWRC